jgi:DNA gyrase/topoisomerase IV subunit B
MITAIVRALFLYHLAECQSGNATTIKINVQTHTFRISDNGRGHAINRTINGLPYLQLVYSQLEYPFGLDTDTPIQLHTIGISLINSLCSELVVMVYKTEKTYIKYYKDGQLNKEEVRENQENVTGTAIEGKINSNLFPREIDLQDLEQWLKKIKSINKQLRLFYNEKEL